MKKSEKVFWFCSTLLVIGLLCNGFYLHSQNDLASVSPASAAYMWRVLYGDAAGNTHLVNEDGTGNKILCNGGLPEAVDASLGRFVFTQRINSSVWRIFSANLDMSNVKMLSFQSGKNIFLYYEPTSKRVIFALNDYEKVDESVEKFRGIRGNIYSVGILGGGPVKLATKYVVFQDIVRGRYVYSSWDTANRDLVSIKLDNTGRTNLTWSGSDEVYCGQFGDKVIYSRLLNGQSDLYAIPVTGGMGNLKVLANSAANEKFGGTSAGSPFANFSKVFYHRYNQQNDEWSLYSVNLDGSGTFPIVTPVNQYCGLIGSYIIYQLGCFCSVKLDGSNRVDLYHEEGTPGPFFFSMDGRAVYSFGREFDGFAVFSTLPNGDSPLMIFSRQKSLELFASQEARRIISCCNNSKELKSVKASGSCLAILGDPGAVKDYLFSTGNRHIFVQWFDTYGGLFSQGLNGDSLCILGDSLFVDANGTITPVLRF